MLSGVLAVLGRRGPVGSVILIIAGAALILVAIKLVIGLGAAGAYWSRGGSVNIGVGIAVGILGMVLIGLGGGSLFGAQARVSAMMNEEPIQKVEPREDAQAAAREQAVPFWICSECRVVEPGYSGCCTRCGQTVGFVQVGGEGERSIAVSSLS